MKVGDLVRNIYTKEFYIVTKVCNENEYVDVSWKWHMPKDHLEVISEN